MTIRQGRRLEALSLLNYVAFAFVESQTWMAQYFKLLNQVMFFFSLL